MKKTFFLSILLLATFVTNAQTYIKINGLSALVAVPQVGIETSIGSKSTFSVDVFASFWKSFDGKPMQAVMLTPEFCCKRFC